MTIQDELALAEEIIYKALAEVDIEKAEDHLIEAYRAVGRARREIRKAQEASG